MIQIVKDNISNINNINSLIDKSFNGTCFSYDWFLKLKNSDTVLKIIEDGKMIGFMPIFNFDKENIINQSTMYIPYGGPVLFEVPKERRNKIRYIRNIEKALINYLTSNYDEVNFSLDPNIIDIMPFIRSGFTPEVRYTYKIDLRNSIENIYKEFGHDRKKDIKRANKRNYRFIVDSNMKYFDVNQAMKWEKKYGFSSTASYVEKYILKTIKENRGMCFVAMENDEVKGGVHLAWDSMNAYILYSFYVEEKDDVAIPFIYYNMIKYLIDNKITEQLDFEGSVFESIEDFNISFGAYQGRFYNLHWNKLGNKFENIYDYGEK